MSSYDLSILIPHYNSPYLLEKLLRSIGEHPGVEVIVVDDNSTESTDYYQAVAEKYRSDHVLFLRNDSGVQSAGACRNIGLDHAHGRWLLFADADDYFLQGWYDTVSSWFGSHADIIYFSPVTTHLNDNMPEVRHTNCCGLIEAYLNKEPGAGIRLRCLYVAPWSKLIRREIVVRGNIRFDTTLYSNDVMFSVMTGISADTLLAVDKSFYCYTCGENYLTARKENRKDRETECFIRHEVECEYWRYLRSHLKKSDLKYVLPISLIGAVKTTRACGLGAGIRYLAMSRKNKLPIFGFSKIPTRIAHWFVTIQSNPGHLLSGTGNHGCDKHDETEGLTDASGASVTRSP